jgi:hypothetical protein
VHWIRRDVVRGVWKLAHGEEKTHLVGARGDQTRDVSWRDRTESVGSGGSAIIKYIILYQMVGCTGEIQISLE